MNLVYIGRKNELEINLVLAYEPCIRWENRPESEIGFDKMNLAMDSKKVSTSSIPLNNYY